MTGIADFICREKREEHQRRQSAIDHWSLKICHPECQTQDAGSKCDTHPALHLGLCFSSRR